MAAGGQVPCPHCGHPSSLTILTQKTRRRRECTSQACGRRFTTYERYADHTFKNSKEYRDGEWKAL